MALAAYPPDLLGNNAESALCEKQSTGRKMIRVVFFQLLLRPGGGETSLLTLLRSMDRKRYTPILICPREGQLTRRRVSQASMLTRSTTGEHRFGLCRRSGASVLVRKRHQVIVDETTPAIVHSDFHSLPYVHPVCRDLKIPTGFRLRGWWFHPSRGSKHFIETVPKEYWPCPNP